MNTGVRSKSGPASCSKSSKRCSRRSIHRESASRSARCMMAAPWPPMTRRCRSQNMPCAKLDGYGLSHLLLMGNTTDFTGTPLEPLMGDAMFRHFRPIFRGKLIANVGMTAERGSRLIAEGIADLVAFGRPYIANPDVVERLATGAPLAEIDWTTVYASGPRGYSDYPAIRRAAAE